MVSDQQIAELLDSLLREIIPGSINSMNEVVHLLESRLGLDLSNKIDLIRTCITAFYSPPPPRYPQLHLPTVRQTPAFTAAATPPPQYQLHFPYPQGPVFRNSTEISFSNPPNPHASNLSSPATKESSQSKPKRRGGAGGLNKLCGVSPALETIVGQPAMARTEIVKQLWVYIRKNNLQDPSNKRKIICNDELRLLFETDATDMFQMNKLLSKHILPLPSKETGPQSKKVKVDEEPGKEMPNSEMNTLLTEQVSPLPSKDTVPQCKNLKEEEPVGENTEYNDTAVLSEALASFFGESRREMTQSEAFRRFSEYIRAQGLEDPSTLVVKCDVKLQELLGCESIPAAGIYDILTRNHLFQRS